MKRHALNVFSLVFGVLLILAAAWIGFPARGWWFDMPRWLLSAAVIVVGAALMSPVFTSKEVTSRSADQVDDVIPSGEGSQTAPGESVTTGSPADEAVDGSSGRASED